MPKWTRNNEFFKAGLKRYGIESTDALTDLFESRIDSFDASKKGERAAFKLGRSLSWLDETGDLRPQISSEIITSAHNRLSQALERGEFHPELAKSYNWQPEGWRKPVNEKQAIGIHNLLNRIGDNPAYGRTLKNDIDSQIGALRSIFDNVIKPMADKNDLAYKHNGEGDMSVAFHGHTPYLLVGNWNKNVQEGYTWIQPVRGVMVDNKPMAFIGDYPIYRTVGIQDKNGQIKVHSGSWFDDMRSSFDRVFGGNESPLAVLRRERREDTIMGGEVGDKVAPGATLSSTYKRYLSGTARLPSNAEFFPQLDRGWDRSVVKAEEEPPFVQAVDREKKRFILGVEDISDAMFGMRQKGTALHSMGERVLGRVISDGYVWGGLKEYNKETKKARVEQRPTDKMMIRDEYGDWQPLTYKSTGNFDEEILGTNVKLGIGLSGLLIPEGQGFMHPKFDAYRDVTYRIPIPESLTETEKQSLNDMLHRPVKKDNISIGGVPIRLKGNFNIFTPNKWDIHTESYDKEGNLSNVLVIQGEARGNPFAVDSNGLKTFTAASKKVEDYGLDLLIGGATDYGQLMETVLHVLDKPTFTRLAKENIWRSGAENKKDLYQKILPRKGKSQWDEQTLDIYQNMFRQHLLENTKIVPFEEVVGASSVAMYASHNQNWKEMAAKTLGYTNAESMPDIAGLLGFSKAPSILESVEPVAPGMYRVKGNMILSTVTTRVRSTLLTSGKGTVFNTEARIGLTAGYPHVSDIISQMGAPERERHEQLKRSVALNEGLPIEPFGEVQDINAPLVRRQSLLIGEGPQELPVTRENVVDYYAGRFDPSKPIRISDRNRSFFMPSLDWVQSQSSINTYGKQTNPLYSRMSEALYEMYQGAGDPSFQFSGRINIGKLLSDEFEETKGKKLSLDGKDRAARNFYSVGDDVLAPNQTVTHLYDMAEMVKRMAKENGVKMSTKEAISYIRSEEKQGRSAFASPLVRSPLVALQRMVMTDVFSHEWYQNRYNSAGAGNRAIQIKRGQFILSTVSQMVFGGDFDKDRDALGRPMLRFGEGGKISRATDASSSADMFSYAVSAGHFAGEAKKHIETVLKAMKDGQVGYDDETINKLINDLVGKFRDGDKPRKYSIRDYAEGSTRVWTNSKQLMGLSYHTMRGMRAWMRFISDPGATDKMFAPSGEPDSDAIRSAYGAFETFAAKAYQNVLDSQPIDQGMENFMALGRTVKGVNVDTGKASNTMELLYNFITGSGRVEDSDSYMYDSEVVAQMIAPLDDRYQDTVKRLTNHIYNMRAGEFNPQDEEWFKTLQDITRSENPSRARNILSYVSTSQEFLNAKNEVKNPVPQTISNWARIGAYIKETQKLTSSHSPMNIRQFTGVMRSIDNYMPKEIGGSEVLDSLKPVFNPYEGDNFKVVAGTGHRPNKLSQYGKNELIEIAKKYLTKMGAEKVISGMAEGWDMAIAQAAMQLNLPLEAAVPFGVDEYFNKYHKAYQDRASYDQVLAYASEVNIIGGGNALKDRNRYMVQKANAMLAFHDGSGGGTFHAVNYARSMNVPVVNAMDFEGTNSFNRVVFGQKSMPWGGPSVVSQEESSYEQHVDQLRQLAQMMGIELPPETVPAVPTDTAATTLPAEEYRQMSMLFPEEVKNYPASIGIAPEAIRGGVSPIFRIAASMSGPKDAFSYLTGLNNAVQTEEQGLGSGLDKILFAKLYTNEEAQQKYYQSVVDEVLSSLGIEEKYQDKGGRGFDIDGDVPLKGYVNLFNDESVADIRVVDTKANPIREATRDPKMLFKGNIESIMDYDVMKLTNYVQGMNKKTANIIYLDKDKILENAIKIFGKKMSDKPLTPTEWRKRAEEFLSNPVEFSRNLDNWFYASRRSNENLNFTEFRTDVMKRLYEGSYIGTHTFDPSKPYKDYASANEFQKQQLANTRNVKDAVRMAQEALKAEGHHLFKNRALDQVSITGAHQLTIAWDNPEKAIEAADATIKKMAELGIHDSVFTAMGLTKSQASKGLSETVVANLFISRKKREKVNAYFARESKPDKDDKIALLFRLGLVSNERDINDIAFHEAGHSLGFTADGAKVVGYSINDKSGRTIAQYQSEDGDHLTTYVSGAAGEMILKGEKFHPSAAHLDDIFNYTKAKRGIQYTQELTREDTKEFYDAARKFADQIEDSGVIPFIAQEMIDNPNWAADISIGNALGNPKGTLYSAVSPIQNLINIWSSGKTIEPHHREIVASEEITDVTSHEAGHLLQSLLVGSPILGWQVGTYEELQAGKPMYVNSAIDEENHVALAQIAAGGYASELFYNPDAELHRGHRSDMNWFLEHRNRAMGRLKPGEKYDPVQKFSDFKPEDLRDFRNASLRLSQQINPEMLGAAVQMMRENPTANPKSMRDIADRYGLETYSGALIMPGMRDQARQFVMAHNTYMARKNPLESSIRATPAVRNLASKVGVDLSQITGTGRNEYITKNDVINAQRSNAPMPEEMPLPPNFRAYAEQSLGENMSAQDVKDLEAMQAALGNMPAMPPMQPPPPNLRSTVSEEPPMGPPPPPSNRPPTSDPQGNGVNIAAVGGVPVGTAIRTEQVEYFDRRDFARMEMYGGGLKKLEEIAKERMGGKESKSGWHLIDYIKGMDLSNLQPHEAEFIKKTTATTNILKGLRAKADKTITQIEQNTAAGIPPSQETELLMNSAMTALNGVKDVFGYLSEDDDGRMRYHKTPLGQFTNELLNPNIQDVHGNFIGNPYQEAVGAYDMQKSLKDPDVAAIKAYKAMSSEDQSRTRQEIFSGKREASAGMMSFMRQQQDNVNEKVAGVIGGKSQTVEFNSRLEIIPELAEHIKSLTDSLGGLSKVSKEAYDDTIKLTDAHIKSGIAAKETYNRIAGTLSQLEGLRGDSPQAEAFLNRPDVQKVWQNGRAVGPLAELQTQLFGELDQGGRRSGGLYGHIIRQNEGVSEIQSTNLSFADRVNLLSGRSKEQIERRADAFATGGYGEGAEKLAWRAAGLGGALISTLQQGHYAYKNIAQAYINPALEAGAEYRQSQQQQLMTNMQAGLMDRTNLMQSGYVKQLMGPEMAKASYQASYGRAADRGWGSIQDAMYSAGGGFGAQAMANAMPVMGMGLAASYMASQVAPAIGMSASAAGVAAPLIGLGVAGIAGVANFASNIRGYQTDLQGRVERENRQRGQAGGNFFSDLIGNLPIVGDATGLIAEIFDRNLVYQNMYAKEMSQGIDQQTGAYRTSQIDPLMFQLSHEFTTESIQKDIAGRAGMDPKILEGYRNQIRSNVATSFGIFKNLNMAGGSMSTMATALSQANIAGVSTDQVMGRAFSQMQAESAGVITPYGNENFVGNIYKSMNTLMKNPERVALEDYATKMAGGVQDSLLSQGYTNQKFDVSKIADRLTTPQGIVGAQYDMQRLAQRPQLATEYMAYAMNPITTNTAGVATGGGTYFEAVMRQMRSRGPEALAAFAKGEQTFGEITNYFGNFRNDIVGMDVQKAWTDGMLRQDPYVSQDSKKKAFYQLQGLGISSPGLSAQVARQMDQGFDTVGTAARIASARDISMSSDAFGGIVSEVASQNEIDWSKLPAGTRPDEYIAQQRRQTSQRQFDSQIFDRSKVRRGGTALGPMTPGISGYTDMQSGYMDTLDQMQTGMVPYLTSAQASNPIFGQIQKQIEAKNYNQAEYLMAGAQWAGNQVQAAGPYATDALARTAFSTVQMTSGNRSMVQRAAQGDPYMQSLMAIQGNVPSWMQTLQVSATPGSLMSSGGGTVGMPVGYDDKITSGQAFARLIAGTTRGFTRGDGRFSVMELANMNQVQRENAERSLQIESREFGFGMEQKQLAREASMSTYGQGLGAMLGNAAFEGKGQYYFEDRSRALSRSQEDYSMQQQGLSLNIQGRGLENQFRQFFEKMGLNERQFTEGTTYQRGEMEIGRKQQRTEYGWQMQNMAYQRNMSELQFGFSMTDAEENIRYSTGRERRVAMRHRDQAVITHSMEMGQMDKEQDRAKTRQKWEEDRFNREKEHFEKGVMFQKEEMELSKKHFLEDMELSRGRFELEKAQYAKRYEFIHQERQLEDEQRAVQRAAHAVELSEKNQIMVFNQMIKRTMDDLAGAGTIADMELRKSQAALQYLVGTSQFLTQLNPSFITLNNTLVNLQTILGATGTSVSSIINQIGAAINVLNYQGNTLLQQWHSMHSPTGRPGYNIDGEGYAKGGYTGDGPRGEVAGVVHTREIVVPEHGIGVVHSPALQEEIKRGNQLLQTLINEVHSQEVNVNISGSLKGERSGSLYNATWRN